METKVTILRSHTIKPATTGEEPITNGRLDTSAWDRTFYGVHAKTVHLYKSPAAAMVETLRESLGQALALYGPLAGRFVPSPDNQSRLDIDCNSNGVVFVEAECNEDLSCFEDVGSADQESLMQLVPAVKYESSTSSEEVPLLLVQLTHLRCGGASLGIAMSHAVADGQSAFNFLTDWARLARGEPLKEAPYLDRRVLSLSASEGRHRKLSFSDHVEFSPPPLLMGNHHNSDDRKKEIARITLLLTEAQLHALKASVNSRAVNDDFSRPYSRYEAVTAHMWRCACKARRHDNEQPTALYFPFNARNRTRKNPIPARYFGNTVFKLKAISNAGELLSNPLGFGCDKLREAIDRVDEDYIWSKLELLEGKDDLSFYGQVKWATRLASDGSSFYGNPKVLVSSWLTLPLHDMDFGWGAPIGICPITRDADGVGLLAPKANDDGSVEVVLCLEEPTTSRNISMKIYPSRISSQIHEINAYLA